MSPYCLCSQHLDNVPGDRAADCGGAITIYSHLQACGIINDHDKDCPCGQRINEAYPTIRKRRDHEV